LVDGWLLPRLRSETLADSGIVVANAEMKQLLTVKNCESDVAQVVFVAETESTEKALNALSIRYGKEFARAAKILITKTIITTPAEAFVFVMIGSLLKRSIVIWDHARRQSIPWKEKIMISVIPRKTAIGIREKRKPAILVAM
jgi:hypothetical protein